MKSDKKSTQFTRRKFVGGMLRGALAAAVAPRFVPMRLLAGETAPSKRIQLGHIGVGFKGAQNLSNFFAQSNISTCVALCDPYRERLEAAATIAKANQAAPKLYHDFRELLADPAVDAVVICTPDHWHVPIGLAAARAGKDLYIEKPLGYSLNQDRAMLEACKKHNRIFQYGSQQRSQEMLKRGVELVLNGYIGELQRIEVWAPQGLSGGSLEPVPVPEGLDYDLYLGPAPMKPCTKDRITNRASYACSDYSLGNIANWGAHPLDIAIWAMDADQTGPFSVCGTGTIATPNALFNTYTQWDMEIRFANGLLMHFMDSSAAKPIVSQYRPEYYTNGTTFFGTKGWVSLSREGAFASNPEWLKLHQCEGNKRVRYTPKYYKAFAESVRDRTPTVAPIEDAVRSDALSHLSVIALHNRVEVLWDPQKHQILSPAPLNEQMTRPVRGSWAQS